MRGESWAQNGHSSESIGAAARASEWLSFLSLLIATLTLAAIPWILGGAIPLASLVLQCGAVLAAFFAMGSMFLSWRFPSRLPLACLPLLGFCVIGLLQLLPVYKHPALAMEHAVVPELAKDLPGTQKNPGDQTASIRSVMPAETRLSISQMLSLALLSVTLFEMARTRRRILIVVISLVLSGCGMSALALSQRFGAVEVIFGNEWKISGTPPFGCFVNPNNAAGWLMVCLSGALLLCGSTFGREIPSIRGGLGRWTSAGDRIWLAWQNLVSRVANLDTSHVLAASSAILLTAGIAATLSRGGIIAAIIGFLAFTVSRYRSGRWILALCSLSVILVLGCGFLVLLELDTRVLSELRTLKDPVSESTGRLLHCTDSLKSCLDFPLLGSGLGGYRYGTLPYQSHYTRNWFQRADNQYVEVLVEAGVFGLACFVGMGIVALILVRRVIAAPKRRRRSEFGSLPNWSASAVFFSVVGLAGAAFFDYGISLPSVAGAMIALVVLLERQSVDLRESDYDSRDRREESSKASAGPYLAVWTSLMVSTTILIPDTFAAARIYSAVVPVEHQRHRPDIDVLSETGDQLLSDLDAALAMRPDDAAGQRNRVLFLELLVRREMLRRMAANREMTPEQQKNAFRNLNMFSLADQVLKPTTAPATRSEIQNDVKLVLEKYPWRESARSLLRESVFPLSVPGDLALCDLALGDEDLAEEALIHVRFAEPHGARSLYLIGYAMLQAGKIETCRTCWTQSLSVSELFRTPILLEAAKRLGTDVALEWFLPDSYEPCAKAAVGTGADAGLRLRLFEQADQLWETARPRLTESVAETRALHLEATQPGDAAAAWLAECLQELPASVPLRKRRAMLLEKSGKNSEAYDEWLRVQAFDPENAEAEKALKRLIRLPPTTASSRLR